MTIRPEHKTKKAARNNPCRFFFLTLYSPHSRAFVLYMGISSPEAEKPPESKNRLVLDKIYPRSNQGLTKQPVHFVLNFLVIIPSRFQLLLPCCTVAPLSGDHFTGNFKTGLLCCHNRCQEQFSFSLSSSE